MRANPYQVVEGVIVAAFTVGAREAFIGLKASFEREVDAVSGPWRRWAAGMAGDVPISSSAGPTSTCSARRRRCSR